MEVFANLMFGLLCLVSIPIALFAFRVMYKEYKIEYSNDDKRKDK